MIKTNSAEECRFDAFCRTVIRNAAKDIFREESRRTSREVSYGCVASAEAYGIQHMDTYHTYEKTYYVGNLEVTVHDEDLGNVLQFLIPARRNVILLGYILGYSDTEISRTLAISNSTVSYRRKEALKKIRELLEAQNNED